MESDASRRSRPPRRRGLPLYLVGLVLIVAAAGGGIVLWRGKTAIRAEAMEVQSAAAERGPRVETVTAQQGPSTRDVTLLGDAHPFAAVTLYAKVSGYLTTITVDKGDTVTAGQVIARIASAETDRQYDSAVADLANKRRLAERSHQLLAHQFVSVEAEQTAQTNVSMAAALAAQLDTLKSYEIVRAPFAGTVTARYVDPGALVQNAETNQSSNQPIVEIADATRLRVYAHLEQQDVPFLHVGDTAVIADAANPERQITAAVSRTAGALDPATRTLLVEIDLDNPKGFLLPGSFVEVTLKLPVTPYPQIPVGALIMRGAKPFVAGIADDDRVHLHPIRIASTDGATVNVAQGVAVGERMVLNLPSTVAEGGRLQPIAAPAAGR